MPIFISKSEADTHNFAKRLAGQLHSGQILALVGDLGSGKTTFTKGLAKGFKIKQTIHSPTFVLMKIFQIPKAVIINHRSKILNMVHIDAYRLQDETELIDIGALDYLGQSGTLVVIEWADRVKSLLKKFGKKVIWINFNYGKKLALRQISIKP